MNYNNFTNKSGYIDKKMSVRANKAYLNGEMPLSKWTKTTILNAIVEFAEESNINIDNLDLNKLTLKELQQNYLINSSWHHTGSLYNKTDFYSISENIVNNLTNDFINEIIKNRQPRKKLTIEEKELKNQDKIILEQSKEIYNKLNIIYISDITKLKNLLAIYKRWSTNKINIDILYKDAIDKIKNKDLSKINQWSKLPIDHYRQEYVKLYNSNIEEYIKKEYLEYSDNKKSILEKIKKDLKGRK